MWKIPIDDKNRCIPFAGSICFEKRAKRHVTRAPRDINPRHVRAKNAVVGSGFMPPTDHQPQTPANTMRIPTNIFSTRVHALNIVQNSNNGFSRQYRNERLNDIEMLFENPWWCSDTQNSLEQPTWSPSRGSKTNIRTAHVLRSYFSQLGREIWKPHISCIAISYTALWNDMANHKITPPPISDFPFFN